MKIGNIEIKGKTALAPMAGITDRAFREICAVFGASYFTSEMISVKGLIYNSHKTFELLNHSEEILSQDLFNVQKNSSNNKKPFAIQLFGNDPDDFAKAIKLLEIYNPDIIDINMGCPATKIVKENSGSALMKNPTLCGKIVESAKKASKVPVTVKIRSGWNNQNLNAPEIAKICENAGADALTIHGRTKEQGYSGTCNLEIIKKVKESIKIPVIGNGDVVSISSAEKMFSLTNCDMIAIGRGAIGNPWIFKEINSYFNKNKVYIPPSLRKKSEIMQQHIEKICAYKGEERGIKECRKHIAGYIKDFPGAAEFRKKAFLTQTKDELIKLCQEISKN